MTSSSTPLRKLWGVLQRLKWPLLGLLACSFVIMLVEIVISEYDPRPGPLGLVALLAGGTLYIFLGILMTLAPLVILIGVPWFLVTRARSIRAKRREETSE